MPDKLKPKICNFVLKKKAERSQTKSEILEDSKSETKEIAEAGALETDKIIYSSEFLFQHLNWEIKDVISFSENAPIYQNVKAKHQAKP